MMNRFSSAAIDSKTSEFASGFLGLSSNQSPLFYSHQSPLFRVLFFWLNTMKKVEIFMICLCSYTALFLVSADPQTCPAESGAKCSGSGDWEGEFFPEIPHIKYERLKSSNPLSYKWYSAEEEILGSNPLAYKWRLEKELSGGRSHFVESCGLPISTYFSAMKLLWLMENVDAVKDAIKKGYAIFGTIDTWLIWNMTGSVNGGLHVTDVTNASPGAAVQWLRDSLGIINSASEIEDLAAMVETTGGVYFVPAFNGLFAPWLREDARGVCIGITRFTNKSHIARAVLESMCFQVKDVLDSLNNEKGEFFLRVDGAATANNLLMHIQADLMGTPVVRPVDIETTALGTAYALYFFLKMLEETDVPTKEDNIVYKEILKNLCEA
ncbi:unnamed protein product [Brassica napus]|uniref:(rape) hypothetical protein n=1 Tax=Brassica napus TaxID=3708 RepID=A0A816K6F8_BRANA|nr:unnamed protein product [Brassica napus]